mmetsp:Transcript_14487/g.19035  ORF Transcript_14487/g.19035 Transcript_14487/m.19035 type:complete len:605 (-) Transcript_14487:113-1927(-)
MERYRLNRNTQRKSLQMSFCCCFQINILLVLQLLFTSQNLIFVSPYNHNNPTTRCGSKTTLLKDGARRFIRHIRLAAVESSQDACPLVDAVTQASKQVLTPLFFPGHKMGRGAPSKLRIMLRDRLMDGGPAFLHDLPELPELDNLFAPEGPINEAEALAAQVYNTRKTWFLVNGSTAGVISGILACVQRHRTVKPGPTNQSIVILPRNVHRSAINALVISGAMPVFLNPVYEESMDISFGCNIFPDLEDLLEKYGEQVAAVVLVSPTYHGVMSDVGAAAKLTQRFNVPLIVDEAHGAHLQFLDMKHRQDALSSGADLVVQSTHKTLTSFTQTAMLHLGKETPFRELESSMMAALEITQSSSPNYLLLCSLDAARWQFGSSRGGGVQLLQVAVKAAVSCREQLKEIGYKVLEKTSLQSEQYFKELDPLKVTVFFSDDQVDGFEADELLIEEYGIYAELPSPKSITFAFGPGSTQEDTRRVVEAMKDISSRVRPQAEKSSGDIDFNLSELKDLTDMESEEQPQKGVTPREAFFHMAEVVDAEKAVGRLSAETICPYPPGIPLLLPGEVITKNRIQYLQHCLSKGGSLTGCYDSTLSSFKVLCKNNK